MPSRWVSLGLHRYGSVLRAPKARRVALAGLLSRTGQFGTGLAVLLAAHEATDSYAVAGTAAGLVVGSTAVGRVVQARVVDRAGAQRVLVPAALLHVAATVALVLLLASDTGTLSLLVLSTLIGVTIPGVPAITRALWSIIAPAPEQRVPAHAIESLVTDVSATAAPALAATLATTISPAIALLAMGAFAAGGGVLLASCAPPRTVRAVSGRTPLPVRPLMLPMLVVVAFGMAAGVVDVAVPVFAEAHDAAAATGPLLALWTASSVAGGIWYGSRAWRGSGEHRLLVCVAGLTAAHLALPFAGSFTALALLLALAGLPMAAMLTTAYLLIDERIPRDRLTEAFAWITSAMPVGVAVGTLIAGWLAAAAGAPAAFALGGAAMVAALAAAAAAAWSVPRPVHEQLG